ncbi:MAG TPA: type II toxin-antitoxin system death-on-curing family toxin [Thermoanaerobaculia bacterium]|nr:type II toxin-antitoxin system death-on-curing family toxin [Thermoanaerobaculia bacterium]
MRYLSTKEVLELHRRLIAESGGMQGLRDGNALESAIAQPLMTFGGEDLYPTLLEKAAALGFSLIGNHPFVDGNKRVGHAAMETFLFLNGFEIEASVDEQEEVILRVAEGTLDRAGFTEWLRVYVRARR